jgi:hypothetical protein
MISMRVSVDCVEKIGGKKTGQLDIFVRFVELRIDNDALLFLVTAEDI